MTNGLIMIVDDDRGFALSLANLLFASGYRTCISHDPAGAIAASRERPLQQDAICEARRQLRTLTERESEVVDAIVAGLSSRQIAEAFSVSQRTVEAHRANVLNKLGLSNTASLVRLAVLAGLGPPQE